MLLPSQDSPSMLLQEQLAHIHQSKDREERRRNMEKVVVVFLLITLIFGRSSFSASAAACAEVGPNIQPCLGALNGMTGTPSTACCDGLKVLVKMGSDMGVGTTCNCTRAFLLNVPGLDVNLNAFNNLQSTCEVDIGFSFANGNQCTS